MENYQSIQQVQHMHHSPIHQRQTNIITMSPYIPSPINQVHSSPIPMHASTCSIGPSITTEGMNSATRMIAGQSDKNPHHNPEEQNSQVEIDDTLRLIDSLYNRVQGVDLLIQANRDLYQNFVIQYQSFSQLKRSQRYINCNQHLYSPFIIEKSLKELQVAEEEYNTRSRELTNVRLRMLDTHYGVYEKLNEIYRGTVCSELQRWKHQQQLLNNGVRMQTININMIQDWIERIIETIWRIKNQTKGLQLTLLEHPNAPFPVHKLDGLISYLNKLLEDILMNSFVVEVQPPQVMKTNTRLTAQVRLLYGTKLNLQLVQPTVKATIMSEATARALIQYHKQSIDRNWTPPSDSPMIPEYQPFSPASDSLSSVPSGVLQDPISGLIMNPQHSTIPNSESMTLEQHPFEYENINLMQVDLGHESQGMASIVDETQQVMTVNQDPLAVSSDQDKKPSIAYHSGQEECNLQQTQFGAFDNQSQSKAQVQHIDNFIELGYNPDLPLKEFESSGEILNSSNILELDEKTGYMSCPFRNMQLKKIKRTEKKGTESVMDEKFVLLFYFEFMIADDSMGPYFQRNPKMVRIKRNNLLFHVLTFSLPVVVIVHGNQEPHAKATVTWHNAFATPDDVLYKVPERVAWRELAQVLSEKFRSFSGRGLSSQNLKYLANKVYRGHVENDQVLISWNQFAKEALTDKFTFWEWFHSILKLTKEHLRDLWRADNIWGFLGKEGCNELLLNSRFGDTSPVGTFVVRFSETELGGVTLAWVAGEEPKLLSFEDKVRTSRKCLTVAGRSSVQHLQPCLSADLKTRSLADRIRDLKELIYLYPKIPKDKAFAPFYSPIPSGNPDEVHKEYVESVLVATLAPDYAVRMTLFFDDQQTMTTSEANATVQGSSENQALRRISSLQGSSEFYFDNVNSMNDMDSNRLSYNALTNDFSRTIQ